MASCQSLESPGGRGGHFPVGTWGPGSKLWDVRGLEVALRGRLGGAERVEEARDGTRRARRPRRAPNCPTLLPSLGKEAMLATAGRGDLPCSLIPAPPTAT